MYREISKYVFDCDHCPTRCDGKSKMVYSFEDDVIFAEKHEKIIIQKLIDKGYNARKCEKDGYPDILVSKKNKGLFYIEVKAQRRTFMSVRKLLPQANLYPSETIALNLSDLLRYFEIAQQDKVKIFIVWVLENRPCITDGQTLYFLQSLEKLKEIYNHYGDKRRFRRKSGEGDVVDGVHKGVVVNYHFSLKELKLWKI